MWVLRVDFFGFRTAVSSTVLHPTRNVTLVEPLRVQFPLTLERVMFEYD